MRRVVTLLIAAVLLAAGCGSDSESSDTTTTGAGATTTTAASGGTTTTAGAAAGATLAVADNDTVGEPIVVAADGRAVYMFTPDGTSTTSQVPDGIKPTWPAVVADGDPVAGDGIDASKLTVEEQPDGTQQVAYNGHLLYLFSGDTASGDANGQALGDVWYVLDANGDQVA